jgi:hypothetical protein
LGSPQISILLVSARGLKTWTYFRDSPEFCLYRLRWVGPSVSWRPLVLLCPPLSLGPNSNRTGPAHRGLSVRWLHPGRGPSPTCRSTSAGCYLLRPSVSCLPLVKLSHGPNSTHAGPVLKQGGLGQLAAPPLGPGRNLSLSVSWLPPGGSALAGCSPVGPCSSSLLSVSWLQLCWGNLGAQR